MRAAIDFMVPVRTEITPAQYRRLSAAATNHGVSVGALVAEIVRRGLTAPPELEPKKRRGGRKSNYTTAIGEQVYEGRRFHRSYQEIGAELGIAPQTAQTYQRRYEAELRASHLNQATKTGTP